MAEQPSIKRTKIVATIGPASNGNESLEALIKAGTNAVRLNMSHGTHAEHAAVITKVRRISKKLNKPLAVLADLQGPKIRLGMLPEEGIVLRSGQEVSFYFGDTYEQGKPLPVQHDIGRYVKAGQPLYLRDGMVRVEITKVRAGIVHGVVKNNGMVYSKQGINLPETDFGGDILTKKDLEDIKFAAAQDVDYVALSFVQTADDITGLQKRLKRLGSESQVIAKIETKVAVSNLEDIIMASGGVMVARGDLAIETQPEQVPIIQKRIIDYARTHHKIAIVATQMLESMISSPQPTRAEVSDVATAVVQGADAVMLSGESAVGKYPVETVAMMRRVIKYTEANRLESITASQFGEHTKRNAISAAAITLASQIGARLIIAETSTGETVLNLSSFRPVTVVIAVTHHKRVYQQMALVWGVRSYLIKDPAKAATETVRMLREEHNVVRGDKIIRASGRIPGLAGGTDTIQVETV